MSKPQINPQDKHPDDNGCQWMTKFIGEQSRCPSCDLPKCYKDMLPTTRAGFVIGVEYAMLYGIKEGARGMIALAHTLGKPSDHAHLLKWYMKRGFSEEDARKEIKSMIRR